MKNGYDWIIAVASVKISEIWEDKQGGSAELVRCLGIMQGEDIETTERLKKILEQNEPAGVLLTRSILRHMLPMGKTKGDEIIVCLVRNRNPYYNEECPFTAVFIKESNLRDQIVLTTRYVLNLAQIWKNLDPEQKDIPAKQVVKQMIFAMRNINADDDFRTILHNIRDSLDLLRSRIAELRKERDININPAEN